MSSIKEKIASHWSLTPLVWMFLWSSATKSSIKSLRAQENQSELLRVPMLDFTNSSDHGALKKTTNLKVLLDVLWPLFSVTSAPHGTFMCRWFRILYTGFTLQTFLCSNCNGICLCRNCYNLSLLRNCSSDSLELWPRLFFGLIQVFFYWIHYGFVCCSNHYGVALWDCSYGTFELASFWIGLLHFFSWQTL
jgi:hypothetical protein